MIKKYTATGLFLLLIIACCTKRTVQDPMVYITNTGSKYHSSSCRYLGKSMVEVPLSKALNRGYEPCSNCNPPVYFREQMTPDSIAKPGE